MIWRREQAPAVFTSERGAPFDTSGIRRLMRRIADHDEMLPRLHPHMLRHACGYALANQGQSTRSIAGYLGHQSLDNTKRCTDLAPNAYRDFWRKGG
jgi:site-specific recombinase XerD